MSWTKAAHKFDEPESPLVERDREKSTSDEQASQHITF